MIVSSTTVLNIDVTLSTNQRIRLISEGFGDMKD